MNIYLVYDDFETYEIRVNNNKIHRISCFVGDTNVCEISFFDLEERVKKKILDTILNDNLNNESD